MRFAKNRLYVESYTKCPNCGVLIFENAAKPMTDAVTSGGTKYCSAWCVEWESARHARLKAETAGSVP